MQKINAKIRLLASRAEPTDGGASFDMLYDGKLDAPSEVQDLLNDDLPIDS